MSKVDERRSETARPVFHSPAQARTTKIDDCHLQRKAIVYVRQSTEHQVRENKESTARQYALVDVAIELGWPADQVIVIDEDQARTAATADGRYGFHRLLAEVGLDHVGIILGIELCRLARSNKDWSQLIELCGIFRTVLADHDGVYDPTDFNDRLLLGLRGIMSEAELHILRGRMHEGKVSCRCTAIAPFRSSMTFSRPMTGTGTRPSASERSIPWRTCKATAKVPCRCLHRS